LAIFARMAVKKKRSGSKKSKGKAPAWKKTLIALGIVLGLSLIGSFLYLYQKVLRSNLNLQGPSEAWLYIKNKDNFEDVCLQLSEKGWLRDVESFRWLAEFLDYDKHVRPGRYALKSGMSNKDLVLLLRSGKQVPLRITYRSIRSVEELCGKTGALLEADSMSLMREFQSDAFQDKYGLNRNNAMSLILPDTYEFYWNTDASQFISKMGKIYLDFWTETRRAEAEAQGLSPAQVAVLASIVQQESAQESEWPVIAGVYLNRFRKGMKLQADPTVVYATGDFSIRRVRSQHLQTDSPYNTYRYSGLPPGPIYLASKSCMDAVLHAQSHAYFYFCARPDRSGLHDFAKTFEEHLRNARKYQQRLNERRI